MSLITIICGVLYDHLTIICGVLSLVVLAASLAVLCLYPKLCLLMLKNLRRNMLRTGLTSVAIIVLVFMVTIIWTVVNFLDSVTEEQSKEIKLIVTEKWQLPSQMPLTHADYLNPQNPKFLPELRPFVGPNDFMTWSFYGGSTEQGRMSRENVVFMFCMNPDHIKPMMDDLQDMPDELVTALKSDMRNVLLGKERLAQLNMRVGDKFKIYSLNYKGIDLEFQIAGEIPGARYGMSGIMNDQYFNKALDDYKRKNNGQAHPLDSRRLNLIWLRVRDKDAVTTVAKIIEHSPAFSDRPVKVETLSSGVASFLDAYRDLLWAMKCLMVPAILISMTLVISNAIAITVRERRTEMAVLKVLGFRPTQILILVLGEALLVGGISGFVATAGTISIINGVYGGIPFPIAFFPAFRVPLVAIGWGLAIGFGTGLLGSFLPAWTARSVKVSEVFAKVA
jgi:putative ABC transport system permease protein